MQQTLRNEPYDKWYALGLLLVVMIVIYFLFFQSYFTEHGLLNKEISELEETRKEHTELAFQIPEIEKRIQQVKTEVGNNSSFLLAEKEHIGISELTRYLKQIISKSSDSTSQCNLTSQNKSRNKFEDEFERVSLSIRLNCQYSKIINVLKNIEEHEPKLFISDISLEQRNRTRNNNRRNQQEVYTPPPLLQVKFDLYGYMNIVSRKKDDAKK